jgi:hypothetical protein
MNSGDMAWMLTSSALVQLMTPGEIADAVRKQQHAWCIIVVNVKQNTLSHNVYCYAISRFGELVQALHFSTAVLCRKTPSFPR